MAKPRPVALSPNARQDALEAYDWYRERSPRAAEQIAYALEQATTIRRESLERLGGSILRRCINCVRESPTCS